MTDSSLARIFNIAAGQPFLTVLAATLFDDAQRHALFGASPLEEVEILLPTRRSARDLAVQFMAQAEAAGQEALLLPQIRTLGDLDDDVPYEDVAPVGGLGIAETGDWLLDVPPAIEPMARHYLLLPLIKRWAEISDQTISLNPVKLSALAFDLESFLDQAQNEQVDWADLPTLAPEELAENWQHTLQFLEIITKFWPQYLHSVGRMDPTERRNELLRRRAAAWREAPPNHPVIAAGSTGSIRATADLLAVIAHLPHGAVVLPGLDMTVSDTVWQAIESDVSHPQHAMAQLLQHIESARNAVTPWPGSAPPNLVVQQMSRALVPAAQTADWAKQCRTTGDSALGDCHLIEAPDPRSEAGAIALIMREVMQHAERTAALVTRDRKLARRVSAELKRWDIAVDDSAGQPLANTPLVNFLRRVLACWKTDFAPVDVLALLKHPLVRLGRSRGHHLSVVRRLEAVALRGPRPAPGLAGMRQAMTYAVPHKANIDAEKAEFCGLIDRLEAAFLPLAERPEPALLDTHIEALQAAAAMLMAGEPENESADETQNRPAQPDIGSAYSGVHSGAHDPAHSGAHDPAHGEAHGPAYGEAGRMLAGLFDNFHAQSDLAGPVVADDWPELFDMWAQRQTLRRPMPVNPQLMILGPLEARLIQADVMILGGLNEGSWPPLPETGPWLSRPMRAALKMSQPERQIGLAAHDFAQGAVAPTVYLTRAEKLDGTPTVAARWLRRLETLNGKLSRQRGRNYIAWWHRLDQSQNGFTPAQPPMPTPPPAARPTQLSVTQIETLLHNPYEIYAKKILQLRDWEPVDAPLSPAHRGSLVHSLLERFIAEGAHRKDAVAAAFLEIAQQAQRHSQGGEALLTFWQARLVAIADWLAAQEAQRADEVVASHVEISGDLPIALADGIFTITAKADRIDALADGRFDIIDYKTGQPPSQRAVTTHKAPQLTLEAAILAAGGFTDRRTHDTSDTPDIGALRLQGKTRCLSYWQISGRDPAATIIDIAITDDLINGAVDMVSRLIDAYRDPARAYPAHIRQGRDGGAYDHLARRAEWRRVVDREAEG